MFVNTALLWMVPWIRRKDRDFLLKKVCREIFAILTVISYIASYNITMQLTMKLLQTQYSVDLTDTRASWPGQSQTNGALAAVRRTRYTRVFTASVTVAAANRRRIHCNIHNRHRILSATKRIEDQRRTKTLQKGRNESPNGPTKSRGQTSTALYY